MELVHADAEEVRMPAHLVQCDEPVIAVERRILEAFGHHRAAILLQLHGAAQDGIAAEAAARLRHEVADQQTAEEVVDAGVDRGLVRPGSRDGFGEPGAVLVDRRVLGIHIGPIDRETGHDLAQGAGAARSG